MKKLLFLVFLFIVTIGQAQVGKQIAITIAGMRTLNLDRTAVYYITDKTLEGNFRYDALDNSTADDGINTIINSGTQRWKRIFPTQLFYNPVASTIQNLDTTNRKLLTWNPTTKQIDVTYWQVPGTGGGGVSSVSGTASRITSTGGSTPVIDISATFEALLGKLANPLSQFASTTSAQLGGIISDETGSGSLVFGVSPLFTTPRLASTSTTGYVWTATDAVGNGSFQAASGGGSSISNQNITTGSSATVTGGQYIVTFNPSSAISSYTLTLPASPSNNDIIIIRAGGTIAAGTVVSAFSLLPNTSQTITDPNMPNFLIAGQSYRLRWSSTYSTYYPENN